MQLRLNKDWFDASASRVLKSELKSVNGRALGDCSTRQNVVWRTSSYRFLQPKIH